MYGVLQSYLSLFPQAQEAESRGDVERAKTNGNIALGLNIAAIGSYVALWIVLIIVNISL